MADHLPRLGVADTRYVTGADSPNDPEAPPLHIASFQDAFLGRWDTDAHFFTYVPDDPLIETWPRINKTALAGIRKSGYELLRHVFVVDWDTPGHLPWGQSMTQEQFSDLFLSVCEKFPLAARFAVFYTTRNGIRLVYILDSPIAVDESESYLRWFIYRLHDAGLNCDELCDWGRSFRLPRVMRDGVLTESEDYFHIEIDEEARLRVSDLAKAGRKDKASVYADIQEINDPRPDEESCRKVMERVGYGGRIVSTQWAIEAKRRLRGRECYGCLFEHQPIAEPGRRDSTIHEYVGQVVSLLYYLKDTTPEHVYALFLPPIQQLEDDQPWEDILWSAVRRLWAKEDAKARAAEQQEREQQERAEEGLEMIVSGMRQWCDDPALHGDDVEAALWASQRLIAAAGSTYYLMGMDGRYRSQPYLPTQLIPAIRTHMPLIETHVPTIDGRAMKEVSHTTLINQHATIVDTVSMEVGGGKGIIRAIDQPHAELVLSACRRNPNLTAKWDEDVDRWLEKLFGPENAEDAQRWIAYALAFEEGATCAISIKGGQGVGKKMLVRGLCECLEFPALATDEDIVGSNQYGVVRSPFLLVNEGWTQALSGKHPADRFRELVSGDQMTANRKWRDPVAVKNPLRIIFTANNLDVIRMLCQRRDLTQEDRDALAIRLMHFDVGDNARDWLRSKGGMKFTSAKGRRWVAPDAGGESDYVVARHFLWLYENRQMWEPGSRLLVEGHGSQELMFEMQTQVGSATLVVEILLKMFDRREKIDGFLVLPDRAFVVTSAISSFLRERAAMYMRQPVSVQAIANVLSGISLSAPDNGPTRIPGETKAGRRRWYELDVVKLQAAADRHGFSSTKLDAVVDGYCRRVESQHRGE